MTEIAGTTRDSIYTRFDKFGFDFYLVDTAGIRRKNKVSEDLEFYSVMRSIRAIENSDVCILMLDATRGIEAQDMNIFQLIQRNNKSLVVVVNKWDLVENKDQAVIKTFENAIRNRMAPFVDFPIIFASALTKQRIFKVLETAKQVYQNRKAHVGTSKLNEVMLPLIEAYPPPSIKGKYIKSSIAHSCQILRYHRLCSMPTCHSTSRSRIDVSWRTRYATTGRCTDAPSTYSYVRSKRQIY